MYFIEKEETWEDLGDGIRRQITGYNNDLMMVKVEFETGAVGSLHHHIHSQSTYVAKGRFEITIDGNPQILSEGDAFFVDPNLVHGAKCLESGMLIDVFNPKRSDFL
ncbi:cupin domain-containing protein [Aegicerativicinus sediminis]|uniref:cupin domain-containing protein n=1 Tax=Aegicerativicinus sediminis TaxID=2893202 RepID=UPI001E3F26B4|nr:cupin domain-containing protein [Aegicerativicinus sediminis]